MVKHAIMWNFKEEALGRTKEENIRQLENMLRGLLGVVPGLYSMEIGRGAVEGNYELCLVAEMEDLNALQVYTDHPEHVKVKEFVRQVTCGRAVCDFLL